MNLPIRSESRCRPSTGDSPPPIAAVTAVMPSAGEPNPVEPIAIDVIATREGLDALEREWNPLLRTTPSDTVFLTWEWVSTWWRVYGGQRELHVMVARDRRGQLVGIAPLMRTRRRLLGVWPVGAVEFIGSGADVTPEYLDFIVRPGFEPHVIAAFVNSLHADPDVDTSDLRPFCATSPNVELLSGALTARGARPTRRFDAVSPVLVLPGSLQGFLDGRSRNYRKKMGEYERRCDRELSPRLRVSGTSEEVRRDLATLTLLHQKRWQGESRAFRSAAYCRFHADLSELLLERGWTHMFVLETADSRPMALLYCFAYGDRYYYYQGGWDPEFARYRVGLVLMHKVIQHAILARARVFDFLRGEEEYKYRWATSAVTSIRMTSWRSRGAKAVNLVDQLFRRVAARGRGTLAASGVRPSRTPSDHA